MDHLSKHDVYESVFIYTKVIKKVNAKDLQKWNKKLCKLDAFNIMQMIYPFTLLSLYYIGTHFALLFLSYF